MFPRIRWDPFGTEDPEICNKCGLAFGNKKVLHIHKSLVHKNTISKSNRILPISKKRLKIKTDVTRFASVHEEKKSLICLICDRLYETEYVHFADIVHWV